LPSQKNEFPGARFFPLCCQAPAIKLRKTSDLDLLIVEPFKFLLLPRNSPLLKITFKLSWKDQRNNPRARVIGKIL